MMSLHERPFAHRLELIQPEPLDAESARRLLLEPLFDLGFRVSVACRMAVDSYRLGRTLHWDAVKEEIL